jgi:glucuronosyltransferase
MPDPFDQRRNGELSRVLSINFIYTVSEKVHQSGLLEPLYKEKFDLILTTAMFNPCFDCFMHKLEAPVVQVSTLAVPTMVTEIVGNHLPPSFVPYFFLSYTDDMTFKERFINTALDLFIRIFGALLMGPKLDALNRKLFGEDCPPVWDIERNVSLILSNSFVPLTTPRPLLPNVVEVGGMHCRPSEPLPKDLDDFLSGAEHGFIYFSMGSVVQTDQIPQSVREIFLNVFGRLKQRVIWKWNSGHMVNLPANVRLSKWLPQQDILGHPKAKVFMTHGGLLSTQEAAYHGVPLLGIPIFADQDMNMKQAEHGGYAFTLEILTITEETLENLLRKLLDDPKYSNKAKELSSIYRNQPQTPVERAVFWTEYVMRHKGAAHLRSAARKLNYFQYRSMDVVAFLLAILGTVLGLTLVSCKFCLRKICSRSRIVADANKKQK